MDASLIHLDTGFAIRALKGDTPEDKQFNEGVLSGVRLGISAVAWSEFLCCPLGENHPALIKTVVGQPEPFTEADAKLAAEFFNLAGRRRGHLTDCMIAATAARLGAKLATTNPFDFHKCRGLKLTSQE